MRKNFKVWSLLLAIMLIIPLFSAVGTVGAAGTGPPTVTVETVSGKAGETVSVKVSIANNPGIAGYKLSVGYDESALEYAGIKKADDTITSVFLGDPAQVGAGGIIPVKYITIKTDKIIVVAGEYDIMGTGENVIITPNANDGLMFTLKFKIKTGTAAGSYPLTLLFGEEVGNDFSDIANSSLKSIDFQPVNGGVNVVNNTTANVAALLIALGDSPTSAEILQAIKDINTAGANDLAAAIANDPESIISLLKKLEDILKADGYEFTSPEIAVEAVGAVLNGTGTQKNTELNITQSTESVILPPEFDSNKTTVLLLDMKFKVGGTETSKLAVPITITMDIPAKILDAMDGKPNPITIIHYKSDGSGKYDYIYPKINGTKMTFTVTEFSTFAIVLEELVISGGTVTGRIRTYNQNTAAVVTLQQGGSIKYTATLGAPYDVNNNQLSQNFTFDNVEAGKYSLVITKPGHVNFIVNNVNVPEADILDFVTYPQGTINNVQNMTLLCGDINGDGTVTERDLSELLALYNKSAPINNLSDLNGDGTITERDLSILLSSYNKSSVIVNLP